MVESRTPRLVNRPTTRHCSALRDEQIPAHHDRREHRFVGAGRIVPHARRLGRDAVLRLKNRDHVSYYRAVMKSGDTFRESIDIRDLKELEG